MPDISEMIGSTRGRGWADGRRRGDSKLVRSSIVHMCLDKIATGPSHPPRQELSLPSRINSDGSIQPGTIRQPLVGVTELMWNVGQTLRVKMMGGTPHIRERVRHYAEEWMQHANIRFDFVDPSADAEIRISFDAGGSWSQVGRDCLWVPFNYATMNFGWFTDNTSEEEFSRVVLHEFGHALGLVHEHQSPVGGVQWDREKAYAYFKESQGWDRAEVDHNVFDKYSVQKTNYSRYDPSSIMHYWIPAEITLDGHGSPGNNTFSATDMEFIRMWYPLPPTSQNASGLLRTGDDCDEIDFSVEYGVVGSTDREFRLSAASGITWWKAIEVPVGASDYRMLEIQDGRSAAQTIQETELDFSRPLRFWKAKAFGAHTRLSYTWDVLTALPGGSRLSLNWKRDRC